MRWAEVDGAAAAKFRDDSSKKAACKFSLLLVDMLHGMPSGTDDTSQEEQSHWAGMWLAKYQTGFVIDEIRL